MLKLTMREIRKSLGRFLAIAAIVALGVGFFCGLRLTKTAMLRTMDDYIEKNAMYDFRLVSTIGFDEQNAAAIAADPRVAVCEGSKSADALATVAGGVSNPCKFLSLPQRINLPYLKAGRLPQAENECLADGLLYGEQDIGKTVVLSETNDDDTLSQFSVREFTIVGIAKSVLYVNYERGSTSVGSGSVSSFVYLLPQAFDMDYDTEMYLRLTDRSGEVYSEAYTDCIDAAEPWVTELADTQAQLRADRLRADAQQTLNEARQTLDEKQQELADAQKKLADAEQDYADGEQKLADAKRDAEQQLADAKQQLLDAQQQIEENEQKLADAREELADGEQQLADAQAEYEQGKRKFASAKQQADQQLNSASDELQSAGQQLSDQQQTLDEAQAALDVSQQQLDTQRAQLDAAVAMGAISPEQAAAAYAQLDAAQQQLTATQQQITAGQQQLSAARQQLQSADAELASSRKEAAEALEENRRPLDEAQQTLAEKTKELADAKQELADGEQQLADAKQELADGWRSYADARVEADEKIADAEQELADARTKLDDGQRELSDGEQKLADAEQEYRDGERELEKLDDPDVFVLDRSSNVGYACFESDSDIVRGVSRVFPLFFFAVAALVCITTMTRMVDEQRTQAGVLKALGYSNGAIMSSYFLYSGLASILGCAAGIAAGSYFLPQMIWQGYNIMYGFTDILYAFDWPLALLSSGAYLVCSLGTTWFAIHAELSQPAAELIRPKAPKAGKRIVLERIQFLWHRIPFLHKVSIRNILRYKKRMIMMAVGIGGCTALLITGFGIQDSISHVADYQYDEITQYDAAVTFQHAMSETERTSFAAAYPDEMDACLFVAQKSMDASANSVTKTAYIVCPERDSLEGFIDLHETDGTPVAFPPDGSCIISRGLAQALQLSAGDTITLRDGDLHELQAPIAAVFENYVYNFVYLTGSTYAAAFGVQPEYETAWLNLNPARDAHEAAAAIAADDNVVAVNLSADFRTRVSTMLQSLQYIVLVVVVCAAALAFIVLYNLTNINITERAREIATIKVLGFYDREANRYILRENIILTVLGALVGLPMGKALHAYVMSQIKIDLMCFDVRVELRSYLISAALTIVFGLLVNLVLRRKIRAVDMAQALKSIE